jgi:hypothetical protein
MRRLREAFVIDEDVMTQNERQVIPQKDLEVAVSDL